MIVGMMYCKNEADVLPMTIPDAMRHVDHLFIADDGSTDKSWEMIQFYRDQYPTKVVSIRQRPDPNDQGQRQSMLSDIQKWYKPEDTWVQLIDADMLIDTGNWTLKDLIEMNAKSNSIVNWYVMNAVREFWGGASEWYPNWPEDLRSLMPLFHVLEKVTYTFRPYPDLYYAPGWKPWPKGFGKYLDPNEVKLPPLKYTVPLMLHYGYRGPEHVFSRMGGRPTDKYGQEYGSLAAVACTFNCFNGTYNRGPLVRSDPRDAWEVGNDL